MNEVGIVVGVLAMIVALGAVFFSSVAVKRMEDNNQEMIRSYVEPLKAQLDQMKAAVNTATKKADSLERELKAAEQARGELAETLTNLDVKVGQLTGKIATLNQPPPASKKRL